jgi:hypothetical protein
MSDCLHCDINELVDQHLAAENLDLAEMASKVAESLVDTILLAQPEDQAKLMADVIANFGALFLEKSTVAPGDRSKRH